jgi:hypothetical protein
LENVEPAININRKNEVDIWVTISAIAIISIPVGMIIYLNPQLANKTLDIIRLIIGPLIGAFAGVLLGFRKNSKHQEELNHTKKLLLLKILRHEVTKSIDLLKDPVGYLIPIDAWNSIVYSGNIVLLSIRCRPCWEIYILRFKIIITKQNEPVMLRNGLILPLGHTSVNPTWKHSIIKLEDGKRTMGNAQQKSRGNYKKFKMQVN